MSISVIIADDHKIVRDGLRTLLETQPDIAVVAEAEDGRSAVQQVSSFSPDVVIMDIAMPDLNGIEATRQIVQNRPGVKVIALSMHSDKRFVGEMLKAGASGYLLKDCAFEELVTAIHAVKQNKVYLSPWITGLVVDNYVCSPARESQSVFTRLSDREREVLQLLAEGKGTKDVAHLLNVSIKTVETHRANIMTKLNLHTVAELTKYAIREGLTTL